MLKILRQYFYSRTQNIFWCPGFQLQNQKCVQNEFCRINAIAQSYNSAYTRHIHCYNVGYRATVYFDYVSVVTNLVRYFFILNTLTIDSILLWLYHQRKLCQGLSQGQPPRNGRPSDLVLTPRLGMSPSQ